MSSKYTRKEYAGMLIATASMIGLNTKGEFFDTIKYIIANEGDFFQPPTKQTKEKE